VSIFPARQYRQNRQRSGRAEAVQALGECGPYVTAGSRESVVIAFPAPN
jgi:hypothetical protein